MTDEKSAAGTPAPDFDEVVDRRGTGSLKWDFAVERGLPADVLPLWVADMDFRAPQPVLDALRGAVDHGIFGYSDAKGDYFEAVAGWFARRHGWRPRPEWLVRTPGVVFALAQAVRAFTGPGDAVLVQPPVYYPFFEVARANGRVVAESGLVYEDGRYTVDFEDFERQCARPEVRLFILCSPHNPTGRVWSADELRRMGQICAAHDVTVVSDEIHCDFAFERPHTPFLKACPELAERSVVCTAPSKTFNLAGLQASNIWVPGQTMREAFRAEVTSAGYSQLNALGLVACKAAYEKGEPWLDALRTYLEGNRALVREFLAAELPQVRATDTEGTYFAWLDCSGLGLDAAGLRELVADRARLWLDDGPIFAGQGSCVHCADQFERVVLACPRATLRRALGQLARAAREAGLA